jgi:carbon storage regulator CsrA
MYAVIKTGGKQYRVKAGEQVRFELMAAEVGAPVSFDEVLMIGDDVQVTVVDIRGDKVRLGITAPRQIPVHRREVYEAIQRENRAASGATIEKVVAGIRAMKTAVGLPPEATLRDVADAEMLDRLHDTSDQSGGVNCDYWIKSANRGADAPGGAAPVPPSPLDPTTGV